MADETSMISTADTVPADSTPKAAEPKKTRAPRAKKVTSDVASSGAKVAPAASAAAAARTGKRTRAARAKPTVAEVSSVAKKTSKPRVTKPAVAAKKAPASAKDEMADLLRLEEENQKLRKLLSEKLRNENADLRKRLGMG